MLKYTVAIAALLLGAPMAFAQGAGDMGKSRGGGMSNHQAAGPSFKAGRSHERFGAGSGASEGSSGSDSARSDHRMEHRNRRPDRGAEIERSDRHVDRRGPRAEVRDRGDWRRPGFRERIRRGHHYGWGPGIGFYFSDGWYYGECSWLRRRALATGSPVWWHRFHRCREFG
jgi:hypothetical protein